MSENNVIPFPKGDDQAKEPSEPEERRRRLDRICEEIRNRPIWLSLIEANNAGPE